IMAVSTLVLTIAYVPPSTATDKEFNALDALYLTVQTMMTVGYGDYSFHESAPWLQAFGILLILGGAAALSTVIAFITNVVVSRRLERAIGRGRATTLRGHVIVCGLGSVGLAVTEGLLAAGQRVSVIERDEDNRFIDTVRGYGVPVIVGDATVRATLLS